MSYSKTIFKTTPVVKRWHDFKGQYLLTNIAELRTTDMFFSSKKVEHIAAISRSVDIYAVRLYTDGTWSGSGYIN